LLTTSHQLLLLAAALAAASPIADPVAAAAPATSSTAAKGTIELITYLASTECEFTSVTSTIAANTCVDLLTDGGESFAFADFASGKSSCKLEVFSKPGCKGRTLSYV